MNKSFTPDDLDRDVFAATLMIRRMWRQACHNLGLVPEGLPDVMICERSVPE